MPVQHIYCISFIFAPMENEYNRIVEATRKFESISLEEMDAVRLMSRVDTKYLVHTQMLPGILEKATGLYRALEINGNRMFRYNSLYLDTPDLRCYFDHHNGIRPRYKVRFREYEDTCGIFLEVKRKISNERTRKSRIRCESIEQELSEKSRAYIEERSPLDAAELSPALWTLFRRITLAGNGIAERITIDLDLSFRCGNKNTSLPFLCVCEVKRGQSGGSTDFMKILKEERIYPGSTSKYCLGTVLLKSPVKYNRFKSKIRKINKLENAYRSYPAAG